MKKAVYKKIDEKIEYVTIHHDEFVDENGKLIAPCDEVIKKVIPIMGVVYEEMTQDEINALEQAEDLPVSQTPGERFIELEKEVKDLKKIIENLTRE